MKKRRQGYFEGTKSGYKMEAEQERRYRLTGFRYSEMEEYALNTLLKRQKEYDDGPPKICSYCNQPLQFIAGAKFYHELTNERKEFIRTHRKVCPYDQLSLIDNRLINGEN